MDAQKRTEAVHGEDSADSAMKLLFVEMGVGYDQHGQDITAAAMRACRDAIASNSIPAFRIGSIPGVTPEHMKPQDQVGRPSFRAATPRYRESEIRVPLWQSCEL